MCLFHREIFHATKRQVLFRDPYLLIFLHVDSRRVYISPSTFHPDEGWVKEQANAFLVHSKETGLAANVVMHDRDSKFTASFDEILSSNQGEVKEAAFRSPNTNAFVERFIQTLQQECLDYFIVFGKEHMDHLVNEFVTHYHEERPHQAKDNSQLVAPTSKPMPAPDSETTPDESADLGIVCRKRFGGLLKSYSRRAA